MARGHPRPFAPARRARAGVPAEKAEKAGLWRAGRTLARIGTLHVRLTIAVAILAHPDRADREAVLRGVLTETTRLEELVAELLVLARMDEWQALPPEEIDLDDLVLEEAARSRAVPVDTRRVIAVKVHGDRKSLGHLVRNLLDNAARHATSRVEISIRLAAGAPVLLIDDDGPGIPEADRARVLERFTRLSSSRSRDDGGAGLGLALVRRVAEQHGGSVQVDRSPLGGARLEVRFPRDAAPGSGGDAAPGSGGDPASPP